MLERRCRCGHVDQWKAGLCHPVQYDPQMNEFHVVHDNRIWVMYYCWFCGGRLPESRRAEFFTKPAPNEVAEVQRLLRKAKTIEQVILILGEPDDRPPSGGEVDLAGNVTQHRQTLRYSKRWKTLYLDVIELSDGRIGKTWGGHYCGDPTSIAKRPWWHFWK